jgi:hypothetical protein
MAGAGDISLLQEKSLESVRFPTKLSLEEQDALKRVCAEMEHAKKLSSFPGKPVQHCDLIQVKSSFQAVSALYPNGIASTPYSDSSAAYPVFVSQVSSMSSNQEGPISSQSIPSLGMQRKNVSPVLDKKIIDEKRIQFSQKACSYSKNMSNFRFSITYFMINTHFQ